MSDDRANGRGGAHRGDRGAGHRSSRAHEEDPPAPGEASGSRREGEPQEFDQEIGVRAILLTGAVLGLIVIVSLAGMGVLSRALKARSIAADPVPAPLAEATRQPLPPEPRLRLGLLHGRSRQAPISRCTSGVRIGSCADARANASRASASSTPSIS